MNRIITIATSGEPEDLHGRGVIAAEQRDDDGDERDGERHAGDRR